MSRVCVIGAGASGLPAMKALVDAGVPFDAFERSPVLGGLWVYENPNGLSPAYRSLHINTSRERMSYRDWPMPADWPDFCHHTLVARYLALYAERFDLPRRITFSTAVERATPVEGGWSVTLSTGEVRRYEALIVANGHHWDPRGPDPRPPGEFAGPEIHSHDYRDPDTPLPLVGKRVLVVGFGNSAMDIACELGHRTHAARVVLSVRTGGYVVPRYIFGRPVDTIGLPPWVPVRVREVVLGGVLRAFQGPPERLGLPRPSFGVLSAHPTVSSELLERVGTGDVVVRPGIERLEGDRVRFTDGSVEEIDAIVWCTGYRISFPFLPEPLLDPAGDNEVPAFVHVWPLAVPNLALIGLVQPLGPVMPLAELQAKLVADWLVGRYRLPDAAEQARRVAETRERLRRRYVASKRHTIQVDFDDYALELKREHRAGARRAG